MARISVLLPLQDERKAGVDCVRAWTAQTADPDVFELIALAPGEDTRLERSVRPLLRPHDRWIVQRGADEYELFNLGAREGRGEFVFVTEAHCVPEPDCLEAMLSELDRTGAPGIRGVSVAEAHGALGELEQSAFEDALAIEEEPDHWRKVLIHSLAIRRDLYLESGGLPQEFGDFAPWVLAIALRERGQRLKFSPRPRVRHVYDGDLDHLGAHVRSFGQGEMRYRSRCPPAVAERYLETEEEWDEWLQHTRAGARRGLRAALALRHPGTWRAAISHSAVAAFGPRATIAAAHIKASAAGRRAERAADPEIRAHHFQEFWRLMSRLGRLEGLAENRPAQFETAATGHLDLVEPLSGRAIGLHRAESTDGGSAFRWTAPLAMLRVAVPGSSRARATLELAPFERPADSKPANPRVAVDNRVVPIQVTESEIWFELDPGERWIALGCNALRPGTHGSADPRSLGLPVRSLSFEPATSQTRR
jgi:hypothetical protein